MVFPGAFIDPLGDLRKERQVLGAEIEPIVRPPEIEAQVLAELALGVFALVPVARLFRPQGLHGNWYRARAARPEQDLVRGNLWHLGRRWDAGDAAECGDRLCGAVA